MFATTSNLLQQLLAVWECHLRACAAASETRALCAQIDRQFTERTGRTRTCGSTATAVMLSGQRLCVAHVGDSRAVLASHGGGIVQLTKDHKPDDPVEAARIRVRMRLRLSWLLLRAVRPVAMERKLHVYRVL